MLVDAVAVCVREGLDIALAVVGSGRHRSELEERVKAQGLKGRVHFLGQMPTPAAVRAELDRSDVFVLPSRQEGLPRAMVEAMARALPCIGSTAGGIPELLAAEDLVIPGDASQLARKIREVVTDPARLMRMSVRNLQKARQYAPADLEARREPFYQHVRKCTVAWWAKRGRSFHQVVGVEASSGLVESKS